MENSKTNQPIATKVYSTSQGRIETNGKRARRNRKKITVNNSFSIKDEKQLYLDAGKIKQNKFSL